MNRNGETKIYDPLDRLRELLPEEGDDAPYFQPLEEETPVDEDGNPMIALPKFEEDDPYRPPYPVVAGVPKAFVASEKKNMFGSRAWDALFQAAQAASKEGTAEALELQRFKEEAEQKRVLRTASNIFTNCLKRLHRKLHTESNGCDNEKNASLQSDQLCKLSGCLRMGGAVRPKLDDAMRLQLREAFDLIDQDGSGAIDVDELEEAFKVLGMKVSRRQVEEMMEEVDEDGSGEVELAEFEQIMTQHLVSNGQGSSGKKKQGADVPFHIMATSYRRKRLMDAIVSKDNDGLNSLIAKAQEYRVLEAEQRANMVSNHLWITTKVAQRIRKFIRDWRARKAIRDRNREWEMSRLRGEFGSDTAVQEEYKRLEKRGERDMGMKVEHKLLDDRTMEKIRLRAKLSSIVHALDAKDQLEQHQLAKPDITDAGAHDKEVQNLHSSLDTVIKSKFKTHQATLQHRVLLAASAHSKLTGSKSVRTQPFIKLEWKPDMITADLELTPRGRSQTVADRLWQAMPSRGVTKGRQLMLAAQRHALLQQGNRAPRASDLAGPSPQVAKNDREPLPVRAASCVPWLSGEIESEEPQVILQRREGESLLPCVPKRRSAGLEDLGLINPSHTSTHGRRVENLGYFSRDVSVSLAASPEPPQLQHVDTSGKFSQSWDVSEVGHVSSGKPGSQTRLEAEAIPSLPEPPAVQGIRSQQTVRLQTETSAAFSSESRSKLAGWHSSPQLHRTSPYHRQRDHSLLASGRSSPAPTLTSQLPGAVTPLLPEVSEAVRRGSTRMSLSGARSPSPTKPNHMPAIVDPNHQSKGGSKKPVRTANRSNHRASEPSNPACRSANGATGVGIPTRLKAFGAGEGADLPKKPRHGGPSNGIVSSLARTGRVSPGPGARGVHPAYLPSQAHLRVQQLGMGPARQFLEVMRTVPQTPQGHRPPIRSHTMQVKSFPFAPVEP
eukprot:CAMPEP_0117650584 /NCGR_PEP_ID=MMETSP0804-20121206/1617_1 /TAXON_ID=1074897 /ORGANISM="Tetraselmis astigmatica, Strain CCMP880" /LENGTH=948 /DNA_ID=CAMNT_0005456465 /DNA_START=82 /DNA_END=2927 /DNA_ORIENTATION=+